MSPRALRAAAIAALIFWAGAAACLVARGLVAPPATIAPPSATATAIETTAAPAPVPATQTPVPIPPTLTATQPVPTLTRTFTPNPSTLITPSPAALPDTGDEREVDIGIPLLIGIGLFLAGMGFVILTSRGHPSW